ncbi:MAG TPA: hypothetical protein VI160_00285, partial [Gemmatimonadales bacterium]
MFDPLSRRDWIKVMGAAGAGALLPPGATRTGAATPILPLTSTSDVFTPPRGRGFQKFSFDFPEPSVEFKDLRFGFRVFSRENVYGMDAAAMSATPTSDGLDITATQFVWAGGQEKAPGRLLARVRTDGDAITCDVTAEMAQPIKAV